MSEPRPGSPREPGAAADARAWIAAGRPDPAPLPVEPLHDSPARELERVRRLELAALLLDAAALRCSLAPFHEVYASLPLVSPEASVWRRRARRSLWRSGHAEVERPDGAAALLGDMLERDVADWPDAMALALAARKLVDGTRSRLLLGHALLAHGESEAAVRVFAELARALDDADDVIGPALRWRAYEGLSCAHEDRGCDRLALGASEAAAEETGCAAGSLVRTLFLALVVGDRRRVLRAVARLDLLTDTSDAGFGHALATLRTRVEVLRGGIPFVPHGDVRDLFDILVEGGGSPAERVCRALVGLPIA